MTILIFIRRISQLTFLSLFVYILWSTTYPLKGLVSPEVMFQIDPLVMISAAISQRLLLTGLVFSAVMLVLTLILGRFFCGWICPLGAFIDCAGCLKRTKAVPSEIQNQKIRIPKFYILGAVLALALLGIQAGWILDPLAMTARVVSLNVIPAVTLALDRLFIFMIQTFKLYGGFYEFYQHLKASLLGIQVHFFSNSLFTLLIFLVIVFLSLKTARFWCRTLCPLGAVYALTSRWALLKRRVESCTHCGVCSRNCRMGAIRENADTVKGECVMCMDCVYDCAQAATKFSWFDALTTGSARRTTPCELIQPETTFSGESAGGYLERSTTGMPVGTQFKRGCVKRSMPQKGKGLTRREFLALMFSSLALGFKKPSFEDPSRSVIRPPEALPEKKFLNACIRCGNCMKVCVTNGLQPILFEAGALGIWTPQLVPEIGYCEYNCVLCGHVCPTGAIPKLTLEQKHKARLGLAVINRASCLPWAQRKECIVCQEHCPIPDKAIKLEQVTVDGAVLARPYIDKNLCVGCGICQNKCPVNPRAIGVMP